MRQRIRELLDEHGELTFRELCSHLNCYSNDEVLGVLFTIDPCDEFGNETRSTCCAQIGEANIIESTILYPKQTGCRKAFRHELSQLR